MNTILKLADLDQSVWLDRLDRATLDSGELRRMIEVDGLRGVTSLASSLDGGALAGESAAAALERIMVRDVVVACDTLRGVYETTSGVDGFASIDVDPTLAHDTSALIDEATRSWRAVDRPNLMVAIPATRAGIPAIEACLRRGINVNATLLFSVARYREVAGAHLRALERRLDVNEPIEHVASVASFFVSPVDTKIDPLLDAMPNSLRGSAGSLRGEIAIANATLAWGEYERILASERWRALAAKGAKPQRLLWGSTSPKDPAYSNDYYVDQLVGPGTIETMTLERFRGYLEHGAPETRLEKGRAMAEKLLVASKELNVDLAHFTDLLESESVDALIEARRRSLAALERRPSVSVA
jgi:transaldolase